MTRGMPADKRTEFNILGSLRHQGVSSACPWLAAAVLSLCLVALVGCAAAPQNEGDLRKAKAAYEAGRFAESERTLVRVLKDEPENTDALRTMALALAAQGKNDQALERYRDLIRLKPDDDQALYNAAVIERLTGRAQEAVADLERAVESSPGPKYADELARTYMQVGRYEDAVLQWETVLAQPSMDEVSRAGIYSAIATAHENARQYDKARTALEKALMLTPNDASLKARLEALEG